MTARDLNGVAKAQQATREVIHEVVRTLCVGDREWDVAARIERGLVARGVNTWLHTPYAWWGDRTRFAGFKDFEPDALPTSRALCEGDTFILDAAPLVEGFPADYAYSGVFNANDQGQAKYTTLLGKLATLREFIPKRIREGHDETIFQDIGLFCKNCNVEVIHTKYPAGVLGHIVSNFPAVLTSVPRVGDGFQLPLIGAYALTLLGHKFFGKPYPLINPHSKSIPQGLYAVEPHISDGNMGIKFESILIIDGQETRWIDTEIFGDINA